MCPAPIVVGMGNQNRSLSAPDHNPMPDRDQVDRQTFTSSMLSILSTPWTPTLNGQVCTPYALYNSVVNECAMPNAVQDAAWTMKTLESELEATPDGKDALWEGILALWRLRLCDKSGAKDDNWRNLVSAWLVRTCRLIAAIGVIDAI